MILFAPILATAQVQPYTYKGSVPVAADFLNIPTDVRGMGMGNLGVATGGDDASIFTNPGKIGFTDEYRYTELTTIGISYSPVATALDKNIKMLTLTGYQWLDEGQYLGLSLQYFSLGDVKFYDDQANETNFVIPNEYAFGLTYSKKFNENIGLGMTAKGILSNLTGGQNVGAEKTNSGLAVAVDVGLFGQVPNNDNKISYGLALTNLGSKISYMEGGTKNYLPMNLKFGGSYKYAFGEENYLLTGLEFSKPLIPSAPEYDSQGNIAKGENPIKSVPAAIFSSFGDSPDGFAGELKEFGSSFGIEAGFNNQFFVRGGYFAQAKQAGIASYITFGLGFHKDFDTKRLRINLAYAMPSTQNFALKGMFKIGLAFNMFE